MRAKKKNKPKYKPTEHSKVLGALIKSHRERKELGLQDAAKLGNMAYQTWTVIESGKYPHSVTRDRIKSVCKALDIHTQSKIYKDMLKLSEDHKGAQKCHVN